MPKSKPHIAIVGGGIGGLFAANALIAHGLRVSVYEQAPALGEIGAGVYLTPNAVRHLRARRPRPRGREMGRPSRPGLAATSATTARRSRRCRSPTPRAGTRPSACTAPTSSISSPPTCPPGIVHYRPPRHRLRAGRRHRPRRNSPTAPPSRPTSWSPPTASTPSCGLTSFRRRSPSSTAPSPTAASFRASACRTGRWTAGRCGPARPSTSWSSRCATARWSTTSASCRPTRR